MKAPGPRPVPDRPCLQGILYVLHTGIGGVYEMQGSDQRPRMGQQRHRPGGAWTRGISHSEMIRISYDQTRTTPPTHRWCSWAVRTWRSRPVQCRRLAACAAPGDGLAIFVNQTVHAAEVAVSPLTAAPP